MLSFLFLFLYCGVLQITQVLGFHTQGKSFIEVLIFLLCLHGLFEFSAKNLPQQQICQRLFCTNLFVNVF